jgi:magnesium transporter
MSMIRDLRAVVRPSRVSLRKDSGTYDATRSPATATAVVDCAIYRDGRRIETETPLTPHEAVRLVRRDGGFVWIGLHEPTEAEFSGIASEFGLHPLAVEDAVQAHQRPKLERYDDSLFTVFKTIHYVEHDQLDANSEVVESGEVMCFTGRDFFITVR